METKAMKKATIWNLKMNVFHIKCQQIKSKRFLEQEKIYNQ